MINEIWLISDGICIYHRVLKDPLNEDFKGLNLEKQLFSGFITALLNFTQTQLDDVYLQKISFNNGIYDIIHVEEILAVLSLNTNYLSEQKLKQSVFSLIDEISYVIQTNDKLDNLRKIKKKNKPSLIPLNEYNDIFDSFLIRVLEETRMLQNQLVMVDILTLFQILEDLKLLFDQLHVESKIFELTLGLSDKAKKVLKNIDLLKLENTRELYLIQKEFKTVVQEVIGSIKKDDLVKKNDQNIHKTLLKFVKKNYQIMKQFNFEDLFFKEFLIII